MGQHSPAQSPLASRRVSTSTRTHVPPPSHVLDVLGKTTTGKEGKMLKEPPPPPPPLPPPPPPPPHAREVRVSKEADSGFDASRTPSLTDSIASTAATTAEDHLARELQMARTLASGAKNKVERVARGLQRLVEQHRTATGSSTSARAGEGDDERHNAGVTTPDASQLAWFEMQLALEAMQEAQAAAITLLDEASRGAAGDEAAAQPRLEAANASEGIPTSSDTMAVAEQAALSEPQPSAAPAPTLPAMPPLRSLGLTRERSDFGQTGPVAPEYTANDLPGLLGFYPGFSWAPPQSRSPPATE